MASPDIGQKSPAKIVQPCGLQFLPRVSGPTQQQSQRQRRCLYKTWNVVSQSFNSLLPQKKIGYRREKKKVTVSISLPPEKFFLPTDLNVRKSLIVQELEGILQTTNTASIILEKTKHAFRYNGSISKIRPDCPAADTYWLLGMYTGINQDRKYCVFLLIPNTIFYLFYVLSVLIKSTI
jgi:hypothetical protein